MTGSSPWGAGPQPSAVDEARPGKDLGSQAGAAVLAGAGGACSLSIDAREMRKLQWTTPAAPVEEFAKEQLIDCNFRKQKRACICKPFFCVGSFRIIPGSPALCRIPATL